MEAGEGRVCIFGPAFEGLLGRIAERGAGDQVVVRVVVLTYPDSSGSVTSGNAGSPDAKILGDPFRVGQDQRGARGR